MVSDESQAALFGDQRRRAIVTALSNLGMEHADLWMRYSWLGGLVSADVIQRFLAGVAPITDPDYDLLAQALNDAFGGVEDGFPVPSARELRAAEGSARTLPSG